MAIQLGIENIKIVLAPFFQIVNAGIQIDQNHDGKVSLFEGTSFVGLAGMQIIPVANQFDEFGAEARDLTTDEVKELFQWAEQNYPSLAEHPRFTEIVKGTFRWVRETTTYLQLIKVVK